MMEIKVFFFKYKNVNHSYIYLQFKAIYLFFLFKFISKIHIIYILIYYNLTYLVRKITLLKKCKIK